MKHKLKIVQYVVVMALAILSAKSFSAPNSDPPALQANLETPIYQIIARSTIDGVVSIDNSVKPSISNDGTVVFVGRKIPEVNDVFLVGNGSHTLSVVDFSAAGYFDVDVVKIDSVGALSFVAQQSFERQVYKGVYRADTFGSIFSTIFERKVLVNNDFSDEPTPHSRLAISDNDILAFSNLYDGEGALYTVTPNGVPIELRTSLGLYYNHQSFDINNAGAVAIQMEYTDPKTGVWEGILVFDTPGETLGSVETTLESFNISETWPALASNNLGQIAFRINSDTTINYHDSDGNLTSAQFLTAGIYIGMPTPYGTPFTYEQIADTSGQFSSFGEVRLNDNGTVIFEATVEVSRGQYETGIYNGGDPTANRLMQTGLASYIGGESHLFQTISLGDLNNQDQLVVQTRQLTSTEYLDNIIWRIGNAHKPKSNRGLIDNTSLIRMNP